MQYYSRGEKKFAPFSFVFCGVNFNAFGVLEDVMNALIVCIAETPSSSCVLFTSGIMSLNFHWSKNWYAFFTSCNITVQA
jgi:hypothetical protein